MKLHITEQNGRRMATLASNELVIKQAQDALDIMADCRYQGAEKLIIHEQAITPDFFDLKKGIAGEILQKFTTYDFQLAIVGDFSKYPGKSLHDFIYESNKTGRILFVPTPEEARARLSQQA